MRAANHTLFAQLEARRRQLEMPKTAVARRSRVSLPTINRVLAGKESKPAIVNREAIAMALGVQIRLGADSTVAEVENAFDFRRRQAVAKAKKLMQMLQGTMALEAQAVDSDHVHQMIEQTVCELLAGSPRKLWDD